MIRSLHSPRRSSGLAPLYVIAAVLDAGFGSVFALLAEIRAQFGFDVFGVGLIGGAGFVSAFAAQVGLARFADRGHARAMIRLGLVCSALAMLALVFATSLTEFVFGRFLFGLGEGAILPAARRVVIARDPKRAGEALGRLAAFQMTGFLAGPVLGSMLNEFFGLRSTFVFTLLLVTACAPLVARIEIPSEATIAGRRVLRSLLANRSMQAMLCAAVGYYGSFGIFEAIWAVYMAERGASQLTIGLTLTLFAAPMILVAPYGGRLAGRRGGMRVALLAIAASVPCVALYGAFESLVALTLLMLIHAVADAMVMPASQLAVAQASAEDLASGQGLYSAVGLAAAAVVALGSGAVYDRFGPAVLFAGWALAMLVSLVIAAVLGRHSLRASPA